MPTWVEVLGCAGLVLLFYTGLGLPLAARVLPRTLAPFLAPGIGWAVHTATALPIFMLVGMSRAAVAAAFAIPLIAVLAMHKVRRSNGDQPLLAGPSIAALLGAALLAGLVVAGILPKLSPEGVSLAAPIFDHSKVAMIDEMARLGVPPGNPFYGGPEGPARLTYYYLWHFSAAELAMLTTVTGWTADAALTGFAAMASLATMCGLAIWISGRAAASVWVVVLGATASIRPLLDWIFGASRTEQFAGYRSGFGGWFWQISWAPQHVTSAMCVVLAIYMLVETARRSRVSTSILFALLMAAGFESSIWVGGFAFLLAAAPVAFLLLLRADGRRRAAIAGHFAGAAVLAILLISPVLYDQFHLAGLRGPPFIMAPFQVVGADVTRAVGPLADWPAFWLIFLIVEFPAFYLTGVISVVYLVKDRTLDSDRKAVVVAFGLMLAASLLTTWLLASTPGQNNDLGWRAVLPAVFALMIFAAVGLTRWMQRRVSLALVAALGLVILGLPDGFLRMREHLVAAPDRASKVFATTPLLWEAVRRHAEPAERIANNPQFLERMTPWAGNISWALLSDRRSCNAGASFLGPFTALSNAEQDRVSDQFNRVFTGAVKADDTRELAEKYNCAVAVVVPGDGAWSRDPFAASEYYRLAEASAYWRVYRAVNLAKSR
ncbi:MAG: hypothetical protein ACR2K5_04675 [Pseudolabrys sp.]